MSFREKGYREICYIGRNVIEGEMLQGETLQGEFLQGDLFHKREYTVKKHNLATKESSTDILPNIYFSNIFFECEKNFSKVLLHASFRLKALKGLMSSEELIYHKLMNG